MKKQPPYTDETNRRLVKEKVAAVLKKGYIVWASPAEVRSLMFMFDVPKGMVLAAHGRNDDAGPAARLLVRGQRLRRTISELQSAQGIKALLWSGFVSVVARGSQ
jgi:hypothetical protein